MKSQWNNNTIICVDDEASVRDIYRRILETRADDSLTEILNMAESRGEAGPATGYAKPEFNVLLASSGEEALEMITEVLENGGRVAAGFFDMRMPGGMDGYEAIEKARDLDQDLICCVVTAYTDRDVNEIRSLFTEDHQDELLYVKKPFSVDELEQGALNMVSAWNRKRKIEDHIQAIEKQRNGLRHILHAASTFSAIPPHSMGHLISGLFFQVLGIVQGGKDGFCTVFPKGTAKHLGYGIGQFENCDDFISIMDEMIPFDNAFESNQVIVNNGKCYMPFINSGQKLGGMYIQSENSILDYLDNELLEVFKCQVVNLIMNSVYHSGMVKREKESITDSLTGLYNRRFFFQRLKEEVNRIRRKKTSFTMMMIDIDYFKKTNDEFGHEAGDRVLQKLGKIFRMAVRDYDLVAGNSLAEIGREKQFAIRYGGEEFSLVLLDTENQGALIAAERLRKTVQDYIFYYQKQEIRLTISIGLYTEDFSKADDEKDYPLSDICKKADEALYQAKSLGRNRTMVYKENKVTS